MKKLNVLGVCAGQGVCLYSFHRSKYFNVVGNIEPRGVFYAKGNPQWKLNFGDIPMDKQLKIKGRVDVIIGHPDCGDSSILRMSRAKKIGQANENLSVLCFLAALEKHRPKFFLLENLPGFLKALPLESWPKSLVDGYRLQHTVLPMTAFGNSQKSRVRLVIVGTRCDVASNILFPSEPLASSPKYNALRRSEDFELGPEPIFDICHVREPLSKMTNLYLGKRRQITYLEAQQRWNDELKDNPRWSVGGKMKNQPGVSKNLKGSFPLTVRKQNRQFGTEGLVLSPREMANIQGVPLDFKLKYSNSNSIYWINKGRLCVTKTMPYELGQFFMRKLRKQHRANKSINNT